MSRTVVIVTCLVLLPALALAVLAFGAADWDRAERLSVLTQDVEDEARAAARRVEGVISDAIRRGAVGSPVGFARDGRWVGYVPVSPSPPDPEGTASAEELRYYRLSVAGGESYEFDRRDPARAVDAYAFFLPRIRSEDLRARLRFRMARAALGSHPGVEGPSGDASKTGGEALLPRLGRRLFRDLVAEAEGVASEEGLPLDILAAWQLVRRCEGSCEDLREVAIERLREAAPSLSTPVLSDITRDLAPGDEGLRETVVLRQRLERAVSAHPDVVRSGGAAPGDGFLLVSAPHSGARSSGGADPSALRRIYLTPLELPSLSTEGYDVAVVSPEDLQAAGAREPGRARHPVRLGADGPVVARVEVTDRRFEEKMIAADRRRTLHRTFVGLLALVTLGGGAVLIRYVLKERQLARIREGLLRNVSHELKTPVTAIRMFSEMLAEDPVSEDQGRRFAGLLHAESSRLSQVFENFLDVTRLGKDDFHLPSEPVDLVSLLTALADGFGVRASEEGVRFEVGGLDGDFPDPVVVTHAPAVERIVSNLLDNALKYRRGAAPRIRLSLESDNCSFQVTVSDNGAGIPRRDHDRVFEEFYRVRYDDYEVKGSGLGLAISRRLARKLGGEITLRSAEGEGSSFILTLPRESQHEQGTHPRH